MVLFTYDSESSEGSLSNHPLLAKFLKGTSPKLPLVPHWDLLVLIELSSPPLKSLHSAQLKFFI